MASYSVVVRKARRISPSDFSELAIPVPPLAEQKKISEILSRTKDGIYNLRTRAKQFASCKASVFSDFSSGKSCDIRRLGEEEWMTGVIGQVGNISISWGNHECQ